jgi:hypothetical protein
VGGPAVAPAFSFCVFFAAEPFIPASQNKVGGTGNIAEHEPFRFVVGAGKEKHLRRDSMINRFMMSVAAVALIAGAGFANAQGTGTKEQPSAGSTAQQAAPPSERGNSAAQSKPSSDMKATQSEDKAPGAAKSQRAEDKASKPSDMKATQSEDKAPGAAKNQRAEDKAQGPKSKMSSENESKGGKDMKAEGKGGKDMKAEQKGAADSKSQTTTQSQTDKSAPQSGQTTTQSQTGTSVQSQTTGQAGAAAKLSTEQRTRITSVIREQHVQPLTSVNFSISVGTRVPRDVRFYPLPREVVTIYPEWRGYEFILVSGQIIVIDPRTFEIVAILDA